MFTSINPLFNFILRFKYLKFLKQFLIRTKYHCRRCWSCMSHTRVTHFDMRKENEFALYAYVLRGHIAFISERFSLEYVFRCHWLQKISRHFLNQSERKTRTGCDWRDSFSRAFSRLHVFGLSSVDWLKL